MKLKPVDSRTKLQLRDRDALPPKKAPGGKDLEDALDEEAKRIAELQTLLWADGRYALLIVLQGRDASGKDGTIKHVFKSVNPQGCQVTSFGVPTELERKHDFLWRVHHAVPPRGSIGIFNRSHYEDVLVVRVKKLVPKKVWSARYDQINEFEELLTESGVVVLKFFLHISRDEQRERFEARLAEQDKNWKFRVGDLDDRKLWDDYTEAYRAMLRKCSPKGAPWYVVPSDDKDLRNYLIARCIADTLNGLDLRYPKVDPSVRELKID
jgi:PPK2 family polyphosphate:nucleotide phosphotransferase